MKVAKAPRKKPSKKSSAKAPRLSKVDLSASFAEPAPKEYKAHRAPRKETTPLEVQSLSSLENLAKISRYGVIVQASKTGLLMHVKREDLVPSGLRQSLTLDSLVGNKVFFHLPQMNLEISGRISRTKLLGKAGFEVAIDFSEDAPEFWRECLYDLLPRPGEIEEN